MTSSKPILRFAPSPNGLLHLGHAYSALTTYDMAQALGGQFLLRIEDIDLARSRQPFIQFIEEDLAWLGMHWTRPVIRQSHRFAAYKQAADRLLEMGILYPCCATRSEIAAVAQVKQNGQDPDGAPLYPGRGVVQSEQEVESRIAKGAPHALRIDMDKACQIATRILGQDSLSFQEITLSGDKEIRFAQPQRWGDAVIIRKDVPASYHLAVVVDDAFQGVTHVTRGRDLLAATDIQRLLQVLMELPEPIYHHHRLVLDDRGEKLSKSDKATSLQSLRETGKNPNDIRAMIEA